MIFLSLRTCCSDFIFILLGSYLVLGQLQWFSWLRLRRRASERGKALKRDRESGRGVGIVYPYIPSSCFEASDGFKNGCYQGLGRMTLLRCLNRVLSILSVRGFIWISLQCFYDAVISTKTLSSCSFVIHTRSSSLLFIDNKTTKN